MMLKRRIFDRSRVQSLLLSDSKYRTMGQALDRARSLGYKSGAITHEDDEPYWRYTISDIQKNKTYRLRQISQHVKANYALN